MRLLERECLSPRGPGARGTCRMVFASANRSSKPAVYGEADVEAEAASRCVRVSAAGTPTEPLQEFAVATKPP